MFDRFWRRSIDENARIRPFNPKPRPTRPGTSLGAILRRRWWIIALTVITAVVVTAIAAFTAAPSYRTSLRLQTLALDDVDVTLFTCRSAGDANSQIALTQEAFSNIVQSPLVTWRTIDNLGLDLSADKVLNTLEVTASGEFVTVSYEGSTAQQAMDVLTTQVENALSNLNSIQARPATRPASLSKANWPSRARR